jgi:hypothetical protein
MDFLDPRSFRKHKIRLVIGYVLIAIAIALGTIILVYATYGYGINTKTGDIVQNGLLFIDSKPGGADIYLNNKPVNQATSARLVLPAKNYDLLIKKAGYQNWERKFTLDEHTISRYVYPFLFPAKPVAQSLKSYTAMPPLFTQSPDHHWILAQEPDTAVKPTTFDQFDSSDFTKPVVPLTLPANLLTKAGSNLGTLTEVEWSTDNNHLLLKHDYSGGSEFIILDRNDPAKSININKLLGVAPAQIVLRNKKVDSLYVYMQDGGALYQVDMGKPALTTPLLKNILAFKSYGNNLITYITQTRLPAGKAQARIWNNGRNYPLYAFNAGEKYFLDVASFSGHTYFTAGSSTDERANIYKDPLGDIQSSDLGRATPMMALRTHGASEISFSDNARFIALEGGQNFAVYDLETSNEYQYSIQSPLTTPIDWMDGHRLIGTSNGNVFVMDYDSTNQHTLVPTATNIGAFFSRDYNQMYTLAPIAGTSNVSYERIDMRAGTDLPKQ